MSAGDKREPEATATAGDTGFALLTLGAGVGAAAAAFPRL